MANWAALTAVLACEAGLLLVAANTGFLGGPAVLANMAADSWMPRQFLDLSSRLVTQNGVVVMAAAAILVLLVTLGNVSVLVVLYSINVFLTFSLSLAGLVRYWWRHRGERRWLARLVLSLTGFVVCAGILAVTVVEKFTEGGWMTLIITGLVIGVCLAIHRHYEAVLARLRRAEQIWAPPHGHVAARAKLVPEAPAAAFIVGSSRSGLVHSSRTVIALWPGFYRNFLVVSARQVDIRSYGGEEALARLTEKTREEMNSYRALAREHGMASKYYMGFGVDGLEEIIKQCRQVRAEFPRAVFFASKLVFEHESWATRLLHNQIVYAIQDRLLQEGMHMVILPMRV